jgi:hypothetical protein
VLDRSSGLLSSDRGGPSSEGTATVHRPSSHVPNVEYLEDIQRTKDTARASSTEKQEDVTQLDRSCSHPVLGDPEPWKVHASKITCEGGHGRGTLDNDQGIPLVEDDPLGLCFKFYAHDLPAILEATFVPRSLVEIHFALLDPDGYHDGVDDANYPIRKCFPTSRNLRKLPKLLSH